MLVRGNLWKLQSLSIHSLLSIPCVFLKTLCLLGLISCGSQKELGPELTSRSCALAWLRFFKKLISKVRRTRSYNNCIEFVKWFPFCVFLQDLQLNSCGLREIKNVSPREGREWELLEKSNGRKMWSFQAGPSANLKTFFFFYCWR